MSTGSVSDSTIYQIYYFGQVIQLICFIPHFRSMKTMLTLPQRVIVNYTAYESP